MMEQLKKLRQHLLTGVSYAIPFIACGGIMIAFAIALATYKGHMTPTGPDFTDLPRLKLILDIGVASLKLMLSDLARYIAHSLAGLPGLAARFLGGALLRQSKSHFSGHVLAWVVCGAN